MIIDPKSHASLFAACLIYFLDSDSYLGISFQRKLFKINFYQHIYVNWWLFYFLKGKIRLTLTLF